MYKELKEKEEILCLIERGDKNLEVLGYTEHSIKHCVKVAKEAERILKTLGYEDHQVELAKIAGLLHDIGNHDETTGGAKDPISVALILADKTDVRRNRVRNRPHCNPIEKETLISHNRKR